MSETIWFSTKIRLVGLLEPGGATGYRDSIFLIRAADFDDAFRRALEVGRAEERTYVNANGVNLRRALAEVISVDWLGEQLEDGKEVYSEPSTSRSIPSSALTRGSPPSNRRRPRPYRLA